MSKDNHLINQTFFEKYKYITESKKAQVNSTLSPDKNLNQHIKQKSSEIVRKCKLELVNKGVEDRGNKADIYISKEKNMYPCNTEETEKKDKKSGNDIPSLYECAKKLKEKVRIVCIDKKLYYYNGCCYQPIDADGVIEIYRNVVDERLHGSRSLRQFKDIYNYLLVDSKIKVKPNMDSISHLAILNNGIYDVRRERLLEFDPNIIAFSYVNAAFVKGENCPKFEKFLYEVTGGNKILVERMWMSLGYILTQSMDAKVFFVMGQAPNSGKSIFGRFIQNLYETQYVSSVALSDLNREISLGTLVGKAVNISLDLPCSKIGGVAVSKLKMMTGGDLLTIDEKYVPQFKYQNQAKFIFASNHPICLIEDDEAFWQRLIFLPFDFTIRKEEQNEELLRELLAEKNAIVSRALKYAKRLMELHYCFPTVPEIERRIAIWRGTVGDGIDGFIKECCITDYVYKGELVQDLYTAYIDFCANIEVKPVTQMIFKKYLENQLGLVHFKMRRNSNSNPQSAFRGIKLLEGDM